MSSASPRAPISPLGYALLALTLIHGYYNFIRKDGWVTGPIRFVKEMGTILVLGQYFYRNVCASTDEQPPVGERHVRQAIHLANIAGGAYILVGMGWGMYLLMIHAADEDNCFDLMDNRLYLVAIIGTAFVGRLLSLKPGAGEVEFLRSAVARRWQLLFPRLTNGFGDEKSAPGGA